MYMNKKYVNIQSKLYVSKSAIFTKNGFIDIYIDADANTGMYIYINPVRRQELKVQAKCLTCR